VLAGLEASSWLLALVGFVRFDPPHPERPFDLTALLWVVVATSAIFVGTSLLTSHEFWSWAVLGPVVGGLVALTVLVVVEERKEHALIPLRSLTTQLPVTGTLAAMIGGAVFVATVELVQLEQADALGLAPDSIGWLFWPMPVGALVAAVLLALVFRTRFLPLLVVAGMGALVLAPAVLLVGGSGSGAVLAAAALLGFGAGATVSPGLFLTGFGVPGDQLGRAFAMVQLLRSLATYAVGPVLLHVARSASDLSAGVDTALFAALGLAGAGLLVVLVVPLLSGARLRAPDLDAWLEGGQALPSPATGVHVRPGLHDEAAEPFLPGSRRR
jgi:hypothetical protein